MTVDEMFANRDVIAKEVYDDLTPAFTEYGLDIVATLVTDMRMDRKVEVAMNTVNASARIKQASVFKAEGDKTLTVVSAEAEAESRYLAGVGLAKERKAIVDGLRDSVSDFSSVVQGGVTSNDVLNMVMTTQYMDAVKDVGMHDSNKNILVVGRGGGIQERLRKRLAEKGSANERAQLLHDL